MKRMYIMILFILFAAAAVYATEFEFTLVVENKSDKWYRFELVKGRILEIAQIDASEYQSIIITEGDGVIEVPPHYTLRHKVKGLCMHKGLAFPPQGSLVKLTPFTGDNTLVNALPDQKEVHRIAAEASDNIELIIGKGYSDKKKNSREQDRFEAISGAVNNAAGKAGVGLETVSELAKMRMIQKIEKIKVKDQTMSLHKIVHEEYDDQKGEFLFIGEFEIRSKPPKPVLGKEPGR